MSLIWFMVVTTDYMQTYVLIYVVCGFLSIVKALLAFFYLRYILFLVDDLSSVWFPWFQSLQRRIGNESADQMLSNDTLEECHVLIQACIQGTDLFSMQFYWWMIVQLLNATVVFTQLSNMLFQMLMSNPEIGGEKWIYALFKGLISTGGFVTSSLIIYWIRHPSRQVEEAVQNLKGSLKDIYFPNDRTANWKGKEVPLVFVVNRITKRMDEFQGLVKITSRELLTWFVTFFLFFFPFVLEDKDTLICSPHNETSTILICKPE